jgi:hypothetical protein
MLSRILYARLALTAVRRARPIHITSAVSNDNSKHTAESYFKDIDESPPPDPKIHRVDHDHVDVQRPHDHPSGQWSQAGTKTKEYQNVSKVYAGGSAGEQLKGNHS